MASHANADRIPELREFIKENDQRLYDYCIYMLHGTLDIDETILGIFRAFGSHYRKLESRGRRSWSSADIRVELFHHATRRIREVLSVAQYQWNVGRDTRPMKGAEEDLLRAFESRNGALVDALVSERIARVDPDFRAPVVLKDVLGFSDDEVTRILELRWGVYRHRLHRGRLELKESLRGRVESAEAWAKVTERLASVPEPG